MNDIFGSALMECYRGEKEPIMLCREDGRKWEFDLQDLFTPYNEWPECERRALAHVKGRVLDIGCGPGRHALWLQDRGFDVVAMDISPLAVRVAKARGVKTPLSMAAQDLAFAPNSFETILLLGNNFGICGNITGTQSMLRQLHKITSGERCAITSCRDVTGTSDPEHLSYHELNRKRGRPIGQITIRVEHKGKVGEWFDLLMVTPREMEEMCKNEGWMMEGVYESENGGYAAVLRKKI